MLFPVLTCLKEPCRRKEGLLLYIHSPRRGSLLGFDMIAEWEMKLSHLSHLYYVCVFITLYTQIFPHRDLNILLFCILRIRGNHKYSVYNFSLFTYHFYAVPIELWSLRSTSFYNFDLSWWQSERKPYPTS